MDAPGRVYGTVTLSGTDASAAIDCTRYQLAGIFTPGTITSTSLTFTASADNSTYVAVREVGGAAAYSVTSVAASSYYPVDLAVFAGLQWVKIVPGSSEGSARTITYVLRPVS